MNRRELGTRYEELAARFLEDKGYHILDRNFRCRTGEIDIIARCGGTLVFAEVKYRNGCAYGYAESAVNAKKRSTIRQVARVYMQSRDIPFDTPCRFDVIAVTQGHIHHITDAF